ncbi:hypothetical protein CTI12_AA564490 [Artemisia annua]|uniref:DUF4220 domain-containing protein n=1 Tax=Artemisia annua TaxID=35608 RepID=A0A2U1KTD9_ARTAN|nr:hypothetical protein CTI12_AA564490 [Artemisia annua]
MYSAGLLAVGGDHRKLFVIIPEHVKNSWDEWALKGLILISIASQIVLFLLGNLRKYNPRTRIRIALWCAYLLESAVASAALGIITKSALDVCSNSHPNSQHKKLNTSELMSFWAPFLLLHLGGPDTITAYSLEDNELWLRHLAELIFQSVVAVYILLLSWPGCSHLPLLSISIYLAGFIKCFERVQALRLANTEYLRESMLGSPDPGPNYPKFMEDFQLRKSQGFIVGVKEVPETSHPVIDHANTAGRDTKISEAYDLFQTFKRIFVDLILTFEDRDNSQAYFRHLGYDEAFSTIEIELGFAYDMLYTKAYVVYTFIGTFLRLTSVLLVIMALVGFCFLCDTDHYRVIDIVITYILISTAVMMEIFAVVTLLRSDWTDHWLSQHNYTRNMKPTKRRWSGSIAQLDLISVGLEEKPASLLHIQKFFGIDKYRVKHRYRTYSNVSDNLKSLIYKQFLKFMKVNSDPIALCSHKGSFSLRENKCDNLLWSISKVEFDQSILIWHIATTLCYYSDLESDKDHTDINVCRVESKHLSEYLLNLLVAYPAMLPIGIGMIRCRDTCAEAMRFFKDKGPINGKVEACQKLLQVECTEVLPHEVKGDRSKSALFDGCRLASSLKKMKREDMWKITSQVWIEMLAYAATHCRGFHHAQQLRKGGEFLTHVWLLMAQLGITEQFQVDQGHARARLNVS